MKSLAIVVALALAGATAPLAAQTLKAALLFPADDTRLERSRAERAYLGHPCRRCLQEICLSSHASSCW